MIQLDQNMFQTLNGSLMVTAAHRYCLGRASYIIGSAIEWLTDYWDSFGQQTQSTILRDTITAIAHNRAGYGMDKRDWTQFANKQIPTLTTERTEWLRNAIKHDEAALEWWHDHVEKE